jgi:Domain of unknown function (DUF3331)
MFDSSNAERWLRTLSLIASLPNAAGSGAHSRMSRVAASRPGSPCTSMSDAVSGARVVKVVERRSSKTVAVCWRDATSGHYAEQVWTLGVARVRAVCALSGAPISRGDAIYRPRHCRSHVPVNAEAAILASTLPREPE